MDKLKLFEDKLLKNFSNYKDYYSLIEYKNANDIIVKLPYGDCKSTAANLLKKKIPTIESAIDKNQFFINMYTYKFGNKYDFKNLNYKKTHDKIEVYCKKHGIFKINPSNLLYGQNCKICSRESTVKFNKENPNGWSSKQWFEKAKKSKYFTGFKVYILKFWNDQEEFYKIGRTFTSIKNRFKAKRKMDYNYSIVDIIPFNELTKEDSKKCIDLENSMKKTNSSFKYLPKNKFCGMQECYYTLNELDFIENHRSDLVGKILDYVYGD